MTNRLLFSFCCLLSVLTASATVTNTIDTVALGELCQIGTDVSPDGWTMQDVDNYRDNYKTLRLNQTLSQITSPAFTTDIVELTLDVVSSSTNGTRRLVITPLRKGEPLEHLRITCGYSPTKNVSATQTVRWPTEEHVRAFRFELVGPGQTGWGIRRLEVVRRKRRDPTVLLVR